VKSHGDVVGERSVDNHEEVLEEEQNPRKKIKIVNWDSVEYIIIFIEYLWNICILVVTARRIVEMYSIGYRNWLLGKMTKNSLCIALMHLPDNTVNVKYFREGHDFWLTCK
jgi:hypothetical protein